MSGRPIEVEIFQEKEPGDAFGAFARQRERARPRVQTIDVRPRRRSGWDSLSRLVRALNPRR